MSIHGEATKTAVEYKDALSFCLFGGSMGLPFMNNYFSMRLVPLVLDEIGMWRRRTLRERDFIDLFHG